MGKPWPSFMAGASTALRAIANALETALAARADQRARAEKMESSPDASAAPKAIACNRNSWRRRAI